MKAGKQMSGLILILVLITQCVSLAGWPLIQSISYVSDIQNSKGSPIQLVHAPVRLLISAHGHS